MTRGLVLSSRESSFVSRMLASSARGLVLDERPHPRDEDPGPRDEGARPLGTRIELRQRDAPPAAGWVGARAGRVPLSAARRYDRRGATRAADGATHPSLRADPPRGGLGLISNPGSPFPGWGGPGGPGRSGPPAPPVHRSPSGERSGGPLRRAHSRATRAADGATHPSLRADPPRAGLWLISTPRSPFLGWGARGGAAARSPRHPQSLRRTLRRSLETCSLKSDAGGRRRNPPVTARRPTPRRALVDLHPQEPVSRVGGSGSRSVTSFA